LIIYTTRVPDQDAIKNAYLSNDPTVQVPSDVIRVTYWIGSNGGLCRQAYPWFGDDNSYQNYTSYIPEPDKNEDSYVIAPEVTDVLFEYYDINSTSDGSGWNSSWTGWNTGLDGITPSGPPTAIRVTLTIRSTDVDGKKVMKTHSHVVPVPTAVGPYSNAPSTSSSSSGTTSTGN
jgi:hypothetical protein